jgi:hypothetical protein
MKMNPGILKNNPPIKAEMKMRGAYGPERAR